MAAFSPRFTPSPKGAILTASRGKWPGSAAYGVFPSYSLAKRHADALVKDLAKGSQVTALHPAQARDALAALERLTDFYRATGRSVSLLTGISEFVEASGKLHGRTMGEAVEGYLRTVASVKRKDINEAVEEFIAVRKPLTQAKAGKRAQLSKNYACSVGLWLHDFVKTFSSNAVCDLGKEHLNLFMRNAQAVGLNVCCVPTGLELRACAGLILSCILPHTMLTVTNNRADATIACDCLCLHDAKLAQNQYQKAVNSKACINIDCRRGGIGRRARLKIWYL